MSSRSASSGRPRMYANEKRSMLSRRKADERIMGPIRRARPVMFPGVPVSALLGFTAFSTSPTENTTESVATQRFHEIGLFQVEAGPRTGPAPNMDPNAHDNTYGRLAGTAAVKQALGQPANGPGASMRHDAWKQPDRWNDQIVVGIAGVLSHVTGLRLDARIAARDASSPWYWHVAMMSFSRGNGQARSVLNAYAEELANVPEATRWRAFRAAVARDITRNTGPAIGRRPGKLGAAYAIIRCDQKSESGKAVADSGELSWYSNAYQDNETDNGIERVLSECAYSEAISLASIAESATDLAAKATDVAVIVGDIASGNPMMTAAGVLLLLTGSALWYFNRNEWYY